MFFHFTFNLLCRFLNLSAFLEAREFFLVMLKDEIAKLRLLVSENIMKHSE
jgi:hypothetical protein